MVVATIRFITKLFTLMLLIIGLMRLASYSTDSLDSIASFFKDSSPCETSPCFISIIPDESTESDLIDLLQQSPYVTDYEVIENESGTSIIIDWNHRQMPFLIADGIIRFNGDLVETIELQTNLTIGEILLSAGQPTNTLLSTHNAYLYYLLDGFVIESQINCDAIWFSPVRVIYRQQSLQLSTLSPGNVTITDFCR